MGGRLRIALTYTYSGGDGGMCVCARACVCSRMCVRAYVGMRACMMCLQYIYDNKI